MRVSYRPAPNVPEPRYQSPVTISLPAGVTSAQNASGAMGALAIRTPRLRQWFFPLSLLSSLF